MSSNPVNPQTPGAAIVFIAITTFALGGCTAGVGNSVAPNPKGLNSYLGQPEGMLMRAWGPPVSIGYVTDGSKYLIYYQSHGGTKPVDFDCSTGACKPSGGLSPLEFDASCMTQFRIVRQRVAAYRYEGGACDPDSAPLSTN